MNSKILTPLDLRKFVSIWRLQNPKELEIYLLSFCELHLTKNPNVATEIKNHLSKGYTVVFKNDRVTNSSKKLSFLELKTIEEQRQKNKIKTTEYIFSQGKTKSDLIDLFNKENPPFVDYEKNIQKSISLLKKESFTNHIYPNYIGNNINILWQYLSHLVDELTTLITEIKKQQQFELHLSKELREVLINELPKDNTVLVTRELLQDRKDKVRFVINRHFSESIIKGKSSQNIKTNQFNNVPIDKVREIFGVLTTTKNRLNKPSYFLDNTQLEDFIKRAFLGDKTIQKLKIKYSESADTVRITHLFYSFKKYSIYYPKENRKYKNIDFVKLLTDNFLGFNPSTVNANFANTPQDKTWYLIDINEVK